MSVDDNTAGGVGDLPDPPPNLSLEGCYPRPPLPTNEDHIWGRGGWYDQR